MSRPTVGDLIALGSGGYSLVSNVEDFEVADFGDKFVELTWQDPTDVVLDGTTITSWAGTQIRRKTGNYPINEKDGVLVVDSKVRDQYKTVPYKDSGLTNDVEYYYMAFPYTDKNVFTVDSANRVSEIPSILKIYGVEIDESNANPLTSVVYTDDAVGFTPANGNNGSFSWGSWENIIKNDFAIRPCILKNNSGEVDYYLDYDNYTKKADGSASVLDGTAGDVMVEFGVPLWWKFERTGNKLKVQLANGEFDGAIKPAFEIENGYNLVSIYQLFLTQILYLLMFKNLDSQTALGKGKESSGYTSTGTTNTKTFCHGTTNNSDNVKFLGMEDYWGNRRWWIDGCFYDSSRNILIGKGSFNDTGSGYTNHGAGGSNATGGFIDKVQGGNHTGFIPASTSGSASQYYCDYGHLDASKLPYFGGGAGGSASDAGGFCLRSVSASYTDANIGGRLSYSKDNKIYIGAYLGYTQSSKLRSRSGVTSSNNKTIGTFRTEAKANN